MIYSFVDLQKPQVELDGKPCAAVGQSGLMALYDSLFSQVYKRFIHMEFLSLLSQLISLAIYSKIL
jgi:hypothetical protein